ncbi:MAG: M1 family metallopeptidase, partial [Bacteroidia bacterium]|nr:M1 family metallopeptidase [Bacteroidia bacterium]
WYPKLCEYDYQGWHANPYVGREFYGVWGDFNVKIKIDREYTVAATGMVQNPQKVGHGYSEKDTRTKKLFQKKKLTWEFKAEDVHDFVWAADPDYTHLVKTTDIGTELHYFFQSNDFTRDNWGSLHNAMNIAQKYLNKHYGVYPYKTYAFIQGGDGGMEYPMATLITGERSYSSLVGVSVHEWVHSWYQMVLGTNESLYAWMDEGFTSFVSSDVMNYLKKQRIIPGQHVENPHQSVVEGFARWAKTGNDEPLSTHADHFTSNQAYGVAAYTKGSVFLKQLEYIIGKDNFEKGMKRYYEEWKFKHPNVNDFIRVMEKVSDLELDWYKEYWVNTTHTIDYGINGIREENGMTVIDLEKIGYMPMPLDVSVELKDGTMKHYYIPSRIMRGEKNGDIFNGEVQKDWPWTNQHYGLKVRMSPQDIERIYIDRSSRFSDIDLSNNVWPIVEE